MNYIKKTTFKKRREGGESCLACLVSTETFLEISTQRRLPWSAKILPFYNPSDK